MKIQKIQEGANKPGARGNTKEKICSVCQGTGTRSKTMDPETGRTKSPCLNCKGRGKVYVVIPVKPMRESENYDALKHHYISYMKKNWAMMPKDLIKYAKDKFHIDHEDAMRAYRDTKEIMDKMESLKSLIEDAEQMYCPKCRINVTPESTSQGSLVCPECGTDKLQPVVDEDSSVGAIAGYNSNTGAGSITKEKKGIKKNFRIKEQNKSMPMKTLKSLVKEAHDHVDLSTKEKTLTNLLTNLSKKGELQAQFQKGYDKQNFFKWLKQKAQEVGAYVSDEYWNNFYQRLKGNPQADMYTVYNATLSGSGLGLNESDRQLRERYEDENL